MSDIREISFVTRPPRRKSLRRHALAATGCAVALLGTWSGVASGAIADGALATVGVALLVASVHKEGRRVRSEEFAWNRLAISLTESLPRQTSRSSASGLEAASSEVGSR